MERLFTARRLSFVPTTNCSLNCRLCCNYMNSIVKRRDIPWESVCQDIDACFAIFDHIEWLQFVGGEVFIYKDLGKILDHARKYCDRFDRIIIESNATVFPNEEIQRAILAHGLQFTLMLSDYGNPSRAVEKFILFCEDHHIDLELKRYFGDDQRFGGWIDTQDPCDLNEPGDVLEVNARNCVQARLQNMHCFEGKLFSCSNACFLQDAGLFPPKEGDFIDLRDTLKSISEQRAIVRDFYEHARRACRYCRYKYMAVLPRYPAAEQMCLNEEEEP